MSILEPGLYRIFPSGRGSVTSYVTAPENTGDDIFLQGQQPGWDRQMWKVSVIDKPKLIYTIDRGDLVWAPPENPPTFGIKNIPAELLPISCLEVPDGAKNTNEWQIVPQSGKDIYAVTPAPFGSLRNDYFVDDTGANGIALSKESDHIQRFGWVFEPVFGADKPNEETQC